MEKCAAQLEYKYFWWLIVRFELQQIRILFKKHYKDAMVRPGTEGQMADLPLAVEDYEKRSVSESTSSSTLVVTRD